MRHAALLLVLALLAGCSSTSSSRSRPEGGITWAIAIHGGAGTISRSRPLEVQHAYRGALTKALELGQGRLARGDRALDVAEAVIRMLEDDPLFNAGRGAVFTDSGVHELDASIMDGRTLACGAVTGVRTVRHPVSLARLVMENTRHILLMGAGAEAFADELGVERVENSWFDTDHRRRALQRVLEQRRVEEEQGTVGCVVLDGRGDLAAATSTGGLTGKRWGRIGDTPIIGAGNYADNRSCAVSGTGTGEEFMRNVTAYAVASLYRDAGVPLHEAARRVVFERMRPGDGGVIAVSREGEIAMVYSTVGMFRGAADSSGRFEVAIWED